MNTEPAPKLSTFHKHEVFAKDTRVWAALLILICALALLLRLVNLNDPLWGDEVMSWSFANRSSIPETLTASQGEPNPPLYDILLHFSIRLLGDSPASLRLPSVVFGVLVVPLVYLLVIEMGFSRRDGIWAAALCATSSVLVYYSQEARSYALFTFLAVLLTIAFLRYLWEPGISNAVVYVCLMILIGLTHYYGLFLLAAQIVCFAVLRRWKALLVPLLTATGLAAFLLYQILCCPFMPAPSGRPFDSAGFLSLINSLTVGTIGMQNVSVIASPQLLAFPNPAINRLLPVAGALLFAFLLVGGALTFRGFSARKRQNVLVLWLCVVIPIGLNALAGSPLLPKPQWLLRAVVFVWPLFFAAVVVTSSRLRLRNYFLVAVIALNGLALGTYFTHYIRDPHAPRLKSLAAMTTSEDLIVADPWYMYPPVIYYHRNHPPIIGFDEELGWIDLEPLDGTVCCELSPLQQLPKPRGRVFVFVRTTGFKWLDAFPDTPIYVYNNSVGQWRPLESE